MDDSWEVWSSSSQWPGQMNRFFFFSFLALSLFESLMLGAGDSEDALSPASPSVDSCAGVEPEPDVASRRRLPRIGMPDTEPVRLVVRSIRRVRRWKFWEEMRVRLVSDSGSGVACALRRRYSLCECNTWGLRRGGCLLRRGFMGCIGKDGNRCRIERWEGDGIDPRESGVAHGSPTQAGRTVGGGGVVYLSSGHRSGCQPIG